MLSPRYHVYIGRDVVILPTLSHTSLDVEPVAVVKLSDPEGIRAALIELIERGNPEVPPPSRDGYRPVVLSYAGVKSWSAFSKEFGAILFIRDGNEYRLEFAAAGSNADDPARSERVAPEEVISRVLAHILAWHRA
jgi:hypothetical protein